MEGSGLSLMPAPSPATCIPVGWDMPPLKYEPNFMIYLAFELVSLSFF